MDKHNGRNLTTDKSRNTGVKEIRSSTFTSIVPRLKIITSAWELRPKEAVQLRRFA